MGTIDSVVDDKKSDDKALPVAEDEIVVEDDKVVKDMLNEPVAVGDNVESVQEMNVSEKIMNDFANIAIESGLSKVNVDVNGNTNMDDENNENVVDLLNMNVDEIANEN